MNKQNGMTGADRSSGASAADGQTPAEPAGAPSEAGPAGPAGQPAGAPREAGPAETGPAETEVPRDAGESATIAALQARIADAEDRRLRALADLDNLRKRCAAQLSRAEADTTARVASQWLPVIDNLDLALEHSQADPAVIIEGIQSIRDQALSVIARLGFPRRDDTGVMFDPARHDAIAARAGSPAAEGSVIEVMRPAYGDPDHQLRPAQVVVAKAD
jgi:molecular chaperone GrpE